MKTYVIACGGSGGHISPGIAVAEELVARGNKVTLIVSKKNVDSVMLKKYSEIKRVAVGASPFSLSPLKFIKFVATQIYAFVYSVKFLIKNKVECIIGFGGFTNAPVILAAFLLRKKIFLHESNVMIGKSIKVLSIFSDRVYLPEGVKFGIDFLNKKVKCVGVPVRKEIFRISSADAKRALGLDQNKKMLLIAGGSQGAKILTTWAIENCEKLNKKKIFVYCLCGSDCNCAKDGTNFKFVKFSDSMQLLYNAADLILARAGASTIAEAMICGKPMILVPYKYAAGNHQLENAKRAEQLGCARYVREHELDSLLNRVIDVFSSHVFNDTNHANMNNAVWEIVDDIIE